MKAKRTRKCDFCGDAIVLGQAWQKLETENGSWVAHDLRLRFKPQRGREPARFSCIDELERSGGGDFSQDRLNEALTRNSIKTPKHVQLGGTWIPTVLLDDPIAVENAIRRRQPE
jgi:hypothetical protein